MQTWMRRWLEGIEPWFASIGLANLVVGTSSILIPLTVSEVFGRSVGSLGLLAGLVSLMGVLGSLVWGRLSDAAHRRKPFVILSFATACACFAGIAAAGSFRQLLILNMVFNLFWVANASVSVLIVIENRAQPLWESRISRLNQIGALGWVSGLGLGAVFLAIAPRAMDEAAAIRLLFAIIAGGAGVAAVLAVRFVPRTTPRFTRRRFRGAILALGNMLVERGRFSPFHLYHRLHPRLLPRILLGVAGFRPGTKRFLVSTWLAFMGLGFFGIPLPLLLADRFSFSSSWVFTLFVIQHAAIVVAYPLTARRIKQTGNKRVLFGALSIRLVIFSAMAIALTVSRSIPSTPVLVAFFLVYGLTWSAFQVSGVALISRLAKPENRGAALGLYNAAAGVGWILAGAGSGYLAESAGYQAAFGASGVFLAASLAALTLVPQPAAVPHAKLPQPSDSREGGPRLA